MASDTVRIPRPGNLPGHLAIRKISGGDVAYEETLNGYQEYFEYTIQPPGADLGSCVWSTHQGSSQENMEIMWLQATALEGIRRKLTKVADKDGFISIGDVTFFINPEA
jgi:hypothetical protein